MTSISKHITLAEAIKSQTAVRKGIDNTPTEEHLVNMKHIAENVFEPIREYFKVPIGISSFYRGPKLNKAIGGSKTSQHVNGEAMDIDADIFGKITNMQIFNYIKDNLLFDQLIFEFGTKDNPDWVHVSLKRNGPNRKQILRAVKQGTKTVYIPW
jgi:zinc D-Ala-D-Ala carboxypeptidase